ncbi:MAG: DNA repair protein RadA, partial [Actinobacteria bacterium]|nr:DNA repair protein RadA [Actinomycetota bacterium]
MGKSSAGLVYECSECGWRSSKWAGRCAGCQAWGTVAEAAVPVLASARRAGTAGR